MNKEAQQAAGDGNLKELYDITRKLAGKYKKPERPVKDKEWRPIREIGGQQRRWVNNC